MHVMVKWLTTTKWLQQSYTSISQQKTKMCASICTLTFCKNMHPRVHKECLIEGAQALGGNMRALFFLRPQTLPMCTLDKFFKRTP